MSRAQAAADTLGALLRTNPTVARLYRDAGRADLEVSRALSGLERSRESLASAVRAVERLDAAVARTPGDADARRYLAQSHLAAAGTWEQLGDPGRAAAARQLALAAVAAVGATTKERRLRATWARALIEAGRPDEAASTVEALAASGYRDRTLERLAQGPARSLAKRP